MAEFLADDRPRMALVSHLVAKYGAASGLTVLDLACRTGSFCHALASQGHWVTGIEGRQSNLDKAHIHPNIEYELGDVRDLRLDVQFDVTLCLGLLYHLTAQDALNLLRTLRIVTRQFVILDTHVSTAEEQTELESRTFYGHSYPEPEGEWASIKNETSWWFTEDSLQDLLTLAGWRSVCVERPEGAAPDRCWFVLFKEGE